MEKSQTAVIDKRNERVEENLGLVHSLARRFTGRGVEYDDLFGAGCIGLIKAAEGFDSERGLMFSTYAVPVILGEIKRIFRDTGPIKVSRSIKETALRIQALREKYIKANGYEPPISYYEETLGISKEAVAEAMNASLPPMSLTRQDDDDDSESIDVPCESGEDKIEDILSLRKEMSSLSAYDRELITLRFYKGKTQSETAHILGTTQVQVSRRERRIIEKLRGRMI